MNFDSNKMPPKANMVYGIQSNDKNTGTNKAEPEANMVYGIQSNNNDSSVKESHYHGILPPENNAPEDKSIFPETNMVYGIQTSKHVVDSKQSPMGQIFRILSGLPEEKRDEVTEMLRRYLESQNNHKLNEEQ